MSKDKLTDYDSAASGNLDVGGISVAEGMLPSGVNNALRELMSHQADAFGAGTPLYVDQTNNRVGIGNAAPTVPLDVTGAAIVSGDLTVDTNTLKVDSTNNRVGIVNASPTTALDVTGDITVSGGVYLGGTGSANYLDDYEIGTWTPSVGGNATYDATNYGRYVKVGNIVTAQFNLGIDVLGTGSTALLSGLPFTSENTVWVQTGCVSYFANLATATNFIGLYVNNNASTISFVGNTGSVTTVTHNAFGLIGNSTKIAGSATYRAA